MIKEIKQKIVCGSCGNTVNGAWIEDTVTGQVWCKTCFEQSPAWKQIQKNAEAPFVAKILFGGSLLLLSLVVFVIIIRVISFFVS